jgi:hypothetical protein
MARTKPVKTSRPAVRVTSCHDCSRLITESTNSVIKFQIPAVLLTQNDKQFFVTALRTEQILQFADVPFLDFDQSLDKFCDYTHKSSKMAPHKPPLWQRPLSDARVRNLAAWLVADGSHCVPDSVLLGERADDPSKELVDVIPSAGKQGSAYTITVENRLESGCRNCGTYVDRAGNPVYRNRCPNHKCSNHEASTSPLQIIDGQHRLHGLWHSKIDKNDVAAVFLLKPKPGTDDRPELQGFLAEAQAELFRQVNTESQALDELHQLWLKRFYDPQWHSQSPSYAAYDMLVELGGNGLAKAGVPNPWAGKVKAHPKDKQREFVDTLRGSLNHANADGVVAEIYPALVTIPAPSPVQVLQNFIQGSMEGIPSVWASAGPGTTPPFANRRAFEAVLYLFPKIKEWVDSRSSGPPSYSTKEFKRAWELQKSNFDSASLDDWKRFVTTGEQAPKQLRSTLEQMWPSPAGGSPPANPSWATIMGPSSGPQACQDWKTYITLAPDPISWLTPKTKWRSTPGYSPPAPTKLAKIRPGDTLTWEPPRNSPSDPELAYRQKGPQWIELPTARRGRFTVPSDWAHLTKGPLELRIRYENIRGVTEAIVELLL